MTGLDFDRRAVNDVHDAATKQKKLSKEATAKEAEAKAAAEAEEQAKLDAKAAEVAARHELPKFL